VVINDALGIAGGARGVIERDRLPLVLRPAPRELCIAFGQQLLVGRLAEALAAAELRVFDVDDRHSALHEL
jgi:hypothetical protein